MLCCYCCLVTKLYMTLCNLMDCSTPGFPVLYYLEEFAQIHVHWVNDAIQPSHSLVTPFSPPASPSSVFHSIRVFSNELTLCIRWPKYLNFSFSISPSNEYSGLIFFKMTDLIPLQSKGLSRVFSNSSKASILQRSAFFMVQLSRLYMTTGKIIVLTIWTFVGKVMSLLLNMLSRFVRVFLPRSKHLLISWLQSPSTVILEPKKIKSVTVSIFLHLFAMKWWNRMPWS